MAVPRAAILALVGVAAVAGLFLFTRVHKSSSDQSSSGQQQSQPAKQDAAKADAGSEDSAAGSASQSKASTSSAAEGGSAKPAARQAGTVTPESLPKPLGIALEHHIPVVVLFYLPRGADDQAVRRNIASIPLSRVGFFEVPIADIAKYSKLATQVGVNSPPTLVVVNARGQATATTGYLDRRSIEQIISDGVK